MKKMERRIALSTKSAVFDNISLGPEQRYNYAGDGVRAVVDILIKGKVFVVAVPEFRDLTLKWNHQETLIATCHKPQTNSQSLLIAFITNLERAVINHIKTNMVLNNIMREFTSVLLSNDEGNEVIGLHIKENKDVLGGIDNFIQFRIVIMNDKHAFFEAVYAS